MREISVITPRFAQNSNVDAFFTLKNTHLNSASTIPGLNLGLNTQAQVEEIEGNRETLYKSFAIEKDKVALAPQVHGNTIHTVEKGGVYPDGDGFVTRTKGVGVAVLVADCGGVLLADTTYSVVAAIHAGWRGALANILPKAIQRMRNLGAKSTSIQAFISPCLSYEVFEVGDEVARQFPSSFVHTNIGNKPHIDLKSFLKSQLLESGVSEDAIEVHPSCTVTESKDFYSYRREGMKSGRMMAFIRLR